MATASWSGSAELELIATCGGQPVSNLGSSGVSVTINATGSCSVELEEPAPAVDSVTFELTVDTNS